MTSRSILFQCLLCMWSHSSILVHENVHFPLCPGHYQPVIRHGINFFTGVFFSFSCDLKFSGLKYFPLLFFINVASNLQIQLFKIDIHKTDIL